MLRKSGAEIELGDFLNINMHRATRKLTLMFHRDVLRPEGLSIQEWRSLLNLGKFGDCHLRELSRLAGLDASYVSKATLELEKKGLVRSYDDSTDPRRKRLTVTKKGSAKIDRIWPQAVALSGRVYCLADASAAPIEPGDLLTTSDTPGHAMKVTQYGRAPGAVLGKAMSPLAKGRGMILVLVNLQ